MSSPPAAPRPPAPVLALTGFAIAALSAMCGIGGGIFAVPVLHYVFRVSLRASVATALCLVWAVSLSATASELLHPEGALLWSIVLVLVAGSLVGAEIGFFVAQRLPARALKAVFCVALLAVGAKIIAMSGGSAPAPHLDYAPGPRDVAVVAAVGVFAGIVVPLLGVGGGLIVVPSLLLALPEVGFTGARATSLAMAVVSASRSLWLYGRAGQVHWGTGLRFGAGAALGAVVGVQLVHRPGAAEIGQVLLGTVLVFAATRFGWDVVRGGRE